LGKNMPTKKKIEQVEELAELFNNSDTIIMADYKGSSVADLSSLRKALSESSAKFKIAKNTLAKLAAEKTEKKSLANEINGPLGFILSNEDPSKLTKILFEYTKNNEIEFNITKGFIDNQIVDESTLVKLSKLPTKQVLLAKIMGSMNSPITNLVFVLNGTVQALATVLQRHVEKAEEAPAAEENAEEKAEEAPVAEEKAEEAPVAEEKAEEAPAAEENAEEAPAAEEKAEEAPVAEEKAEEAPAAEEKVDEASVEENTTEEK
jgi:large subunit ribosomal protein L10